MDIYKISKLWFLVTMLCLISALFLLQVGMSYFPFIWAACGIIVIYRARYGKNLGLSIPAKISCILIGFLACWLSFSMSSFRMAELSILLSGLSIIFFSLLGFRNLLLPSCIPIIIGLISRTAKQNLTSLVAPLVDLTFRTALLILSLFIQIESRGHTVIFPSRVGNIMYIGINTSCSGAWSLGAFAIAMLLILLVFPYIYRKWLVFFSIGLLITYLLNILRVTMVCLIGWYTGSYEYLQIAHTHIGWILFTAWMLVFWYIFIPVLSQERRIHEEKI